MSTTDQFANVRDLASRHCKPCEGDVPVLEADEISRLLRHVPGWMASNGELTKTYKFKDFYQTMAFVNAIAWVANTENHHPDLAVSYNKCQVRYSTHTVGGITENDFICAAKIDTLLTV